jgi:nickel/cobalt transporter (NiCoT) family protein
LSLAIAVTSVTLKEKFESFQSVGGFIGTSISAFFLFAIAAMNILILIAIWRTFESVKQGKAYVDEDLDLILARRGVMSRIFRFLFRLITGSWQMLSGWLSLWTRL